MGGAVVERRPPSSSHIQQHKSGNPKAKGNGWGAKGGDSMVVDSVGRGRGRKGGGEEKGRIGMGAATQTGASSWGVGGGGQQGGQGGGGGAPQRRVLFHSAHNKGSLASSQQQQHSGALLRPLNAPMAGCSNENNGGGNNNNNGGGSNNSRAGPSGSPSSQHESLNWAPVSRIVSPLLASLVGLSLRRRDTDPQAECPSFGGSDLFDVVTGRSSWFLK